MESHRPTRRIQVFEQPVKSVVSGQKSQWQVVRPLVESGRLRDLPDDATTTQFPFWRKYMSRILRFLAVSLALAVAAPAAAQVQTGSILVKAVDEQGAIMPGVNVTISSPVLVAGSMNGV